MHLMIYAKYTNVTCLTFYVLLFFWAKEYHRPMQ